MSFVNRLHIYNTENDETDYQTGQEIHVDLALNQFLSESFAIGLLDFYLKQITGDSGRGATLSRQDPDAPRILVPSYKAALAVSICRNMGVDFVSCRSFRATKP
jgi:hypothetical protein